jgi:hypothetical protein
MQVPIVDVLMTSPTHDKPAPHTALPVRHGPPLATQAAQVPVVACAGTTQVSEPVALSPQSAEVVQASPTLGRVAHVPQTLPVGM